MLETDACELLMSGGYLGHVRDPQRKGQRCIASISSTATGARQPAARSRTRMRACRKRLVRQGGNIKRAGRHRPQFHQRRRDSRCGRQYSRFGAGDRSGQNGTGRAGGFRLVVVGNTDLKGAVISSGQEAIDAGKNSLKCKE